MAPTQNEWSITRKQLLAGRIVAGLSVRELARFAGYSSTTIHQLETGKTKAPRARTVEAVKTVLEARGVEFSHGGWVRTINDREHECGVMSEPQHAHASALSLAKRLVSALASETQSSATSSMTLSASKGGTQ